jgi:hypothetical protein
MSTTKRHRDARKARKARKSLGIKVFGLCAELRGEEAGGGKSVVPGKACRVTGQFLMTIADRWNVVTQRVFLAPWPPSRDYG